jgi:hypothetical protein
MSDDYLLVATALTGVSLCMECLAVKTGLTLTRAEQVLRDFATGLKTHPTWIHCDGCRKIAVTYRLLG